MLDALLSTRTEMSCIKPVDFHRFAESLEFLFVHLDGSGRRAGIMAPLDDQYGSPDMLGIRDR